MDFTKAPGFGERFTFPDNLEISINGDTFSTIQQAAVRMAERWEEAVVEEIVKEAHMAGFTEVTVLNKEVIMEALRSYLTPQKSGEWISVEDRLPELYTKVLCCGIRGGRFIAETSVWGRDRNLCWTKNDGRRCPTVTHWMPLPEPPKGE